MLQNVFVYIIHDRIGAVLLSKGSTLPVLAIHTPAQSVRTCRTSPGEK